MASKSQDLYTNKDELLSISTFMSLKWLNTMRKTSKRVNKWLSDPSTFSWKKRIELSFPSTFKAVLQEEMEEQQKKLRKFDTLMDSGHQVSVFPLTAMLDVASVEVTFKYQVPFKKHLYLIVYNQTNAFTFDSLLGKWSARVKFEEMKSITTVLFDNQNDKVGFLNKQTGAMKLYELRNNALKYEADFVSDILKEHGLVNQIYGDCVIVKDDSKLVWHSLSSNTAVKKVTMPEDFNAEGVHVHATEREPSLYLTVPWGTGYAIHQVDCCTETPTLRPLYNTNSDITFDNCDDGVEDVDLTETADGQVIQVYMSGTGDREYHAYDLKAEQRVSALHFKKFWGYESIKYNPGTTFYSIHDGSVLALINSAKKYEDGKCDRGLKKPKEEDSDYVDPDEESYDVSETEDPTEGAFFKFNSKAGKCKWLNEDLFALTSPNKQRFFSIAKRAVIGSIDDDIGDVFIADKTIVAFTTAGDVYRVTLNANNVTKPQGEPTDKNKKKKGTTGSKKRKLSEAELDNDKADSSPPKKEKKSQLVNVEALLSSIAM